MLCVYIYNIYIYKNYLNDEHQIDTLVTVKNHTSPHQMSIYSSLN